MCSEVAEVGVLVQDTCILLTVSVRRDHDAPAPHLLDADGALDGLDTTFSRDKVRVEIGDASEAVASQLERVGQRTDTILARVKGVLAVVREGGFAVLDTSVKVARFNTSHIQARPSLRQRGDRTAVFRRSRRRGT
jgi:hypothetical protein